MNIDIVRQIEIVGKAPAAFLMIFLVIGGAVWRFLKWRYEGIIEGLEHRLKLKDDTIAELKRSSSTLSGSSGSISVSSNNVKFSDRSDNAVIDKRCIQSIDSDRDFVAPSVTIDDLRALYDNRTAIQADRQADIYIGKWMNFTGSVHSVYNHTEGRTRIRLLDKSADLIGIRGIWLTFNKHRAILETLKRGDTLHGTGCISDISQFDVDFKDCELLNGL